MRPALISLLLMAAEACAQIAITNVTVVDVETGALRANQTVVIEDRRIAAADEAARVPVPAGARVIPGKGKFLIPGLWDMHVHDFTSPRVPEIFVENGVTGVRDMYDKGPLSHAGPRVVRCGAVLDKVDTPEQGRQAVRQQIAEGVDFIKVYNGLPREVYFAIADECKRARIPFVGHTPDAVTTVEAASTGQRSIEHLDGVLLDCSSNSAWLRFAKRFIPDRVVLETFSPAVAARVFDAYVRYGTWHCPTLTIYRAAVLADRPEEAQKDPKLKLVPKEWVPKPVVPPHHDEALDRAVQKKMMDVTAMMYRAGVRLLAGTDTGYPYVLPGFGLHDELELMVEAGIPAPAVLRIATLGAAQFLGREKELGTVTRGKLADLVLLDADPLQSIANTRLVRAVIVDGRVL